MDAFTNYDVLLQEASSQKIQNITALNAIRITSAPGNTFSHKSNIYPVTFWCGVCAKQTLSPVYFKMCKMQPICGGRSGLSSWQHLPSEMLHVREVRESVEFLRGIGGRYFQSDHDNRYFLLDNGTSVIHFL